MEITMDDDLEGLSREDLVREVRRLRAGIRARARNAGRGCSALAEVSARVSALS